MKSPSPPIGTSGRARRRRCIRSGARTRGRASTPRLVRNSFDREIGTRRRAAASPSRGCRRRCRSAALRHACPATRPGGCGTSRRPAPISGSPTASAPTFLAAAMYRSSSTGDIPGRRRCCRTRKRSRPAAAASPDPPRARADRELRWRTRRGSDGGGVGGRDWVSPPRDPGLSRESNQCGSRRPSAGARPAAASSRRAPCERPFPRLGVRRDVGESILSSASPAALTVVVTGDAVLIHHRPGVCRRGRAGRGM